MLFVYANNIQLQAEPSITAACSLQANKCPTSLMANHDSPPVRCVTVEPMAPRCAEFLHYYSVWSYRIMHLCQSWFSADRSVIAKLVAPLSGKFVHYYSVHSRSVMHIRQSHPRIHHQTNWKILVSFNFYPPIKQVLVIYSVMILWHLGDSGLRWMDVFSPRGTSWPAKSSFLQLIICCPAVPKWFAFIFV
jgi:hypothetical protein